MEVSDRPKGSDSPSKRPSDVLEKIETQSKVLQSLLKEVATIRSALPYSETDRHIPSPPPSPKAASYRDLWQNQILKFSVNDDVEGLLKAFVWRKGLTLAQLLSPHRPWNRWQYQLSYPRLSSYLEDAAEDQSSRTQVICEDLNERGKVSRWESKEGVLDQRSLWHSISTRTEPRKSSTSIASANGSGNGTGNGNGNGNGNGVSDTDIALYALSRNLRVLDLSPMVAAMILGATPRINLSNTAPFLERYLSFCNWGQASLFGMKSRGGRTNAYTFEYHFAFYFVPKGPMDPDLAVKDFRNLRRSSAFGPVLTSDRSKWIYEEQLSFLLMGQGSDVFTTYQLAERYFRGPYVKGAGQASLFINPDSTGWTPCAMFLSWILLALHHARFRWQGAIEAVDEQIASPSDIIFSEEDPDLLSDDPQFSKSKTYFWALQAYKMFDERLQQTIDTWAGFRKDSLHKLNDGRMPQETWDFTVASIDVGIEKLRLKLHHVREKSVEVQNLRAGLFGASALFDSRTTVKQGDNIRLLTYITLLFLPLSFCTSIFGMQVVLPQLPIKVFIITVPTIFVFTALLIFNLQNIIDAFDLVSSRTTTSLRRSMRQKHGDRWAHTAKSLQYDLVTKKAPTRRSTRQSTKWFYLEYGVEALIVHLPASQVNWLICALEKLRRGSQRPDGVTKELSHIEIGDPTDQSRAARVRAVKLHQIAHYRPEKNLLKSAVKVFLLTIRLLALPLCILIMILEYLILLPFSLHKPNQPLRWLGLQLTPCQPTVSAEDEKETDPSNQPRSRKTTIVSMAGSDNVFKRKLHPSRSRWRKAENSAESGFAGDGNTTFPPSFRDDVFGSALSGSTTMARDFSKTED